MTKTRSFKDETKVFWLLRYAINRFILLCSHEIDVNMQKELVVAQRTMHEHPRWLRRGALFTSVILGGAVLALAGYSLFGSQKPKAAGIVPASSSANSACCALDTQDPGDGPEFAAVKVTCGDGIDLAVNSSNARGVPSGGTWQAEYGTIDADGKYTAPTFIPPYGLDTITYQTESGTVDLSIYVIARPGTTPDPAPVIEFHRPEMPGSNQEGPYNEQGGPEFPTQGRQSRQSMNWTFTDLKVREFWDSLVSADKTYTIIEPGTQVAPPVPVSDCEEIQVDTFNENMQGYALCARVDGMTANDVLVAKKPTGPGGGSTGGGGTGTPPGRKYVDPPIKCKPGPFNGPLDSTDCLPNVPIYCKIGPTTEKVKDKSETVEIATLTGHFKNEDQVSLRDIWGIKVEVGVAYTIHLLLSRERAHRYHHVDIYKCVNGKYKYQYTLLCEQYGWYSKYVTPWHEYFGGPPPPPQWLPDPASCSRVN